MDGSITYGAFGRLASGIAGFAGILSALATAAQQANLFSIVPEKYAWVLPTISIIALFLTVFSERVQGGASQPAVRAEAKAADVQKATAEGVAPPKH